MADLAEENARLRAELAAARAQVQALTPPTWRLLHEVLFELATVSEMNEREHHMVRSKRAAHQRKTTDLALWLAPGLGRLEGPKLLAREGRLLVCITRLAAGRLDEGDNLTSSAKHVRDAIAVWLGCGDGAKAPVRWEVYQEPHRRYRLRPWVKVQIFGVESEAGGQMRIGGGT